MFSYTTSCIVRAVTQLEFSVDPRVTIARLKQHRWELKDATYLLNALNAIFWLALLPSYSIAVLITCAWILALLIPLTSQFFVPATPVFAWLVTYFSSKYIPTEWRPSISVVLLPTLESVLYGANISDLLTRATHPLLDILAWIPYGVLHFANPFIVAAFLWVFRGVPPLKIWAAAFGYMNLTGVICQILFPCSAPWYELIHGLTPANYSMDGSPGGLLRIDRLFGSNGYTETFSHHSAVVFGAFPSLHSANATIEALFISHFFPKMAPYAWGYVAVLYWATMYLTHHYLVDVVAGASLAAVFYFMFMPDALDQSQGQKGSSSRYDLEGAELEFELQSDDEDQDIPYRSPAPPNSAASFHKQQRGHKHTASLASIGTAEGHTPREFVFPQNRG